MVKTQVTTKQHYLISGIFEGSALSLKGHLIHIFKKYIPYRTYGIGARFFGRLVLNLAINIVLL